MEDKIKLFIPNGVKNEVEYIPGFNINGIKYFFIGVVVSFLIATIISLIIDGELTFLITFIIGVGISYISTKKDNFMRISFVEQVLILIKFYKGQKKYKYVKMR